MGGDLNPSFTFDIGQGQDHISPWEFSGEFDNHILHAGFLAGLFKAMQRILLSHRLAHCLALSFIVIQLSNIPFLILPPSVSITTQMLSLKPPPALLAPPLMTKYKSNSALQVDLEDLLVVVDMYPNPRPCL